MCPGHSNSDRGGACCCCGGGGGGLASAEMRQAGGRRAGRQVTNLRGRAGRGLGRAATQQRVWRCPVCVGMSAELLSSAPPPAARALDLLIRWRERAPTRAWQGVGLFFRWDHRPPHHQHSHTFSDQPRARAEHHRTSHPPPAHTCVHDCRVYALCVATCLWHMLLLIQLFTTQLTPL